MNTNTHYWSYLAKFFLEWEMFQTKVVEKIKTHILRSNFFFFRKSCRLCNNVEKNIVELWRATDTVPVPNVLDTDVFGTYFALSSSAARQL